MNFPELLKRLALSLMMQAVLMTAVYYLIGFNPIIAVAALFPILYFAFSRPAKQTASISLSERIEKPYALLLICFSEFFILSSAVLARTHEPLITPWQVMPLAIFITFAIASATLVYYFSETDRYASLLLTLHAASIYCLSLIIFPNGFGYDPHVHRAAEEYIWKFGALEPKTPYYIGQYVLVLTLHAITGAPISFLDSILTPLIALFIPTIAVQALQTSYGYSKTKALFGTLALFFIPSLAFTFSVPHNLTAIIFLIIILLGPGAKTKESRIELALLGLFALSLHPLLGMPSLILAITLPRFDSRKIQISVFLAMILCTPVLFSVYLLSQGESILSYTNPFSRIDFFISLFRDPFAAQTANLFWTSIYTLRQNFPIFLFIGVLTGCLFSDSKLRRQTLLFSLSMLISLFLFSTLYKFPGILFHEQAEYALRYKHAIALALLPALMCFFATLAQRQRSVAMLVALLVSPLALYFSYPTFDAKSSISAWNVARADYQAVEIIQSAAKHQAYLALTNSLTAVAALEIMGFEPVQLKTFPFQVHDQGSIAEMFHQFLETPTKSSAEKIILNNHLCALFVATSNYEPWFRSLNETALKDSEANFQTSDGVIHIYQYKSSESPCK